MLFPARHLHRTAFGAVQVSNLLHGQEIAYPSGTMSSGTECPPRSATPFLVKTLLYVDRQANRLVDEIQSTA